MPRARQLPVLRTEKLDSEGLVPWLEKHRPDAVLTVRYREVCAALSGPGARDFKDLLVVGLEKRRADDSWPGIFHDPRHTGGHAVNLLASALGLNDRGLPDEPCESLISVVWSPGA